MERAKQIISLSFSSPFSSKVVVDGHRFVTLPLTVNDSVIGARSNEKPFANQVWFDCASVLHFLKKLRFMEAEPRTVKAVKMPLLLCLQILQGKGGGGWEGGGKRCQFASIFSGPNDGKFVEKNMFWGHPVAQATSLLLPEPHSDYN